MLRKRGRPTSSTEGAAEAHDAIDAFMNRCGLNPNTFALRFGMTPSTVGRALPGRDKAAWTPSFTKIYGIAINSREEVPAIDLSRLASYSGPGEAAVKRILADVDELVRTLSERSA